LYSGAQFFVFTPIYEGFGMSPLESYACGTPVIASNVASVPEAAGEAAVYIDPYDVNDIREKIEVMVQKTEQDRSQFDRAMEKHLESLSWRPSAEITAASLTGLPREYFQSKEGK
jgi:alpha-1,3-rhamnosyl/mannosyltransferase